MFLSARTGKKKFLQFCRTIQNEQKLINLLDMKRLYSHRIVVKNIHFVTTWLFGRVIARRDYGSNNVDALAGQLSNMNTFHEKSIFFQVSAISSQTHSRYSIYGISISIIHRCCLDTPQILCVFFFIILLYYVGRSTRKRGRFILCAYFSTPTMCIFSGQ